MDMTVVCKRRLPNWDVGIPEITDPNTWPTFSLLRVNARAADSGISASVSPHNRWARCFWIYSVFFDAPNDSRLRGRSHSSASACFIPTASFPRGRHPHKKGPARSLESNANATSSASNTSTKSVVAPRPACLRRPPTLFTPSPASRLRAAARIHSRGVVEHLRVEAYLRSAQLVIARAREGGGAAVRALTSDSQATAGLLREEEAVEEKRAELARAVGSRKTWTMDGGSSEEMQGMIPRGGAGLPRRGGTRGRATPTRWRTWSSRWCIPLFAPTPALAVQETITDAPGPGEPRHTHEIHHDPTTHRTALSDARPPAPGPAQLALAQAQAQASRRCSSTHALGLIAARGRMNERSSRASAAHPRDARCSRIRNPLLPCTRRGARGVGRVSVKAPQRSASIGNRACARWGTSSRRWRACHGALPGVDVYVPAANSLKTLMVLRLSPLAAHLNESLTSLKFTRTLGVYAVPPRVTLSASMRRTRTRGR
ncbi:hypothetical protein FB451DRAFT_1413318 [Mycena latifolia]|nr:hypothetical protein FB451DRAFT_1413318 [Mycena latifolia]